MRIKPVAGPRAASTDNMGVPPHANEAEQSLIGALLLDNRCLDRVQDVEEAHFYRRDHRLIWRHITALIRAGESADVVTVWSAIDAAGDAEASGGFGYLVEIANNTPSSANARSYARVVIDRWMERELLAAAAVISDAALAPAVDIVGKIAAARDALATVVEYHALRNATAESIVPVTEFIADDAPANWVVDGLIQREYLYALTGPTNAGKTALTIVMALCVAAGARFGGHQVQRGNVLILCGENESGFRSRLAGTMRAYGIRPEDIAGSMFIFRRAMALADCLETLRAKMRAVDLSLVIIDTSIAFFGGDKEDDNVQARDHAMLMRRITQWHGGPAVLANCHPTKHCDRDHNVPRGGSAFLNEIDANLTVWNVGERIEIHWQRKKRGPDFDPIEWELETTKENGNEIVVAKAISDVRSAEIRASLTADENRLLWAMAHHPKGTLGDWASACGWVSAGRPQKSKVHRMLDRLMSDKLVGKNRHGYYLTQRGKAEASGVD